MSGIYYNGILLFPGEVVAGDQIDIQDINLGSDYPASTHTLDFALVKLGDQILEQATPDGDLFDLTVSSTKTVLWTVGHYNGQAYITVNATNERKTLATGVVDVLDNYIAAAGGLDARSDVKKTLDALNAMILGKATKDQMSYSIEGRSLARIPWPDLLDLRDKYQRLWNKELADLEAGGGKNRQGIVRFEFSEPS